ncbi:RNA polymerase II C-terminal domain phosphatase-like 4 isoform X2 [Vitis riparia]|uniref:RNA polymerase II C-terminal domain phosphatase-like 4 isoform X2 n=1 Tax=Vitis riparia TaxID=96939 RepID=UPI00155A297D|nr:RNA polymerase II C-terminal domain phosphatase-like 4 isoform X2 [Vitis riparia]
MDHRWYPVMAFHLYVSKGSLFMLESMPMLAKLRPFVCIFLKEASKMFEMYVYTMGEQFYALEMVKVLDPRTVYFSSSVISQADSTQRHQKGLDVVLGPKSAVLILDDTEREKLRVLLSIQQIVGKALWLHWSSMCLWTIYLLIWAWKNHKDNLILMERYHFFASSCHQFGFHCKSVSELKSDESEPDGALATILKVLQQTQSTLFDPVLNRFGGKSRRDAR